MPSPAIMSKNWHGSSYPRHIIKLQKELNFTLFYSVLQCNNNVEYYLVPLVFFLFMVPLVYNDLYLQICCCSPCSFGNLEELLREQMFFYVCSKTSLAAETDCYLRCVLLSTRSIYACYLLFFFTLVNHVF